MPLSLDSLGCPACFSGLMAAPSDSAENSSCLLSNHKGADTSLRDTKLKCPAASVQSQSD